MHTFLRNSRLTLIFFLLSAAAFGQAPVANFTATPTGGCAPLVVQFTNTSTGTGLSYQWSFGNAITSTLQNPSTIYLNAGNYTVSLTVTDANGLTNTKTVSNYITVSSPPTVNFYSPDTVAACSPMTVHFYNTTSLNASGAGTYKWDFGDGSAQLVTSSAAMVTHTYDTCGTFNISLIATNSLGCSQILTRPAYIDVNCLPIANFSSANSNSCTTPLSALFNASSSTGAISYSWNFGDGPGYSAPSASTTATHTYTTTGSYTVTLIATNANGCKDTLVRTGYVNTGALHTSFTVSDTTVCTGNSVCFTNTTTPGAGSSLWKFGNGITDTATSPCYSYPAAGTYTVKLKTTYANCTDSATATVVVAQGPTIAFTGTPLGSCNPPMLVNFTNTTTGAASYQWLFGDGGTSSLTNPSHNYTAIGLYNVSLIATTTGNTCSDTLTKPNYVKIFQPTAVIGGNVNLGCAPGTAALVLNINAPNGTSGYTYSWNWGDGNTTSTTVTNNTHSYTNPGAYTVTVTGTGSGGTSGCSFTTTTQVFVGLAPNAAFTVSPNDSICYGSPFTFNNTSTGATTYQWFFGDGSSSTVVSPAKNYGNPGSYNVMLVANNYGCKDTAYLTVFVKDPKAAFTWNLQNCSNRFIVCFTNQSISTGPTVYHWDFGVGATLTDTSNVLNPCFTFPALGTYTVKLTVTNLTTGCVNIKSNSVKIFNLDAQFTAADTTICKDETASFCADSNVNYASYIWNYGDGSAPDTNTTPCTTHTYSTAGVFTIKLTVKDIYGCTDVLTRTGYMHVGGINNPNFTGTPLTGCAPLTVNFTTSGTIVGTTLTNYTWYFGQTAGSFNAGTSTTASYTYTVKDTFTVKLIIHMAGCTDSVTRQDYIITKGPTANFTFTGGNHRCPGDVVAMPNTSAGTATPITYQWNYGDPGSGAANAATTLNGSHQYLNSGTYSIRLIATDGNGCKDTTIKSIFISTINASFTASDTVANCPPLTVNFTNTSTADAYGTTTYFWIFGNGATSSQTNPSTIYTAPGTYTAKLIVYSSYGCTDTFTKQIHINTGPTATLTYPTVAGCAPLSVCFTLTGVTNTTSATADFEDGSTSNITLGAGSGPYNFCHTYNQGGVFTPVVVLTNGSTGCVTVAQNPHIISVGKPKAGFFGAPNPVCKNDTVHFTDTSSTPAQSITSWSWTFGDGGTSSLQNPVHVYTTSGIVSVRLIVSDSTNCKDTVYHNITVNPQPTVNAGADQAICIGGSTTLTASGANSYTWGPSGTGLSTYSGATTTSTPGGTTAYYVIGTSSGTGCKDTDYITVSVYPLPPAPTVTTPITYCQNATASPLTATGMAGSTLKWYTVATGGTPLPGAPTPSTVTAPSSTTWYVSQTSSAANGGCEGPRTAITVIVNATPAAPVVNSPVTYCKNATASPLTATAANGNTLYWYTTATGGTGSTTAPTPVTTATGNDTFWVSQKSTGANGCEGPRAMIIVIVNPLPAAPAVTTPINLCQFAASSPLTATASGSNTLKWYTLPAGGAALSGAPTPSTALATILDYYVSQQSSTTGCEGARAHIVVNINAKPNVNAGVDQTVCTATQATLTATGAATYTWTPAISCATPACASGTVTPLATTTYTVIGTTNGCADTDAVQVSVVSNPTVSVTPNPAAFCTGGSIVLTASGASTYSWTPNTGLSSGTGAVITASPAATTTYVVTGTAGSGTACQDTAHITVTVNPLPGLPAAATPVSYCQFATASPLSATASGSNVLQWYTVATGGTASTTAPTPVTTVAGNDTFWVSQKNPATGCEGNRKMIVVIINPKPAVNAGLDQTICTGTTATLTATGAATYTWSPAISCVGAACASGTVSPASTTSYTVTGTSAAGCTNTDVVQVAVVTNPTVSVTPNPAAVCNGSSIVLTASGASTYSWTPATGLSSGTGAVVTASPTSTTTYVVTGIAGSGSACQNTASVTVTVNALPGLPAATTPVSYCQFATASPLSATPSGSNVLQWYTVATGGTASTTAPTPVTTVAGNDTFWVSQKNPTTGCEGNRKMIVVIINPQPVVNAGADQTVCTGTTATLTATGASTYTWSPAISCVGAACASGTVSPASTTSYTVTGTSAANCVNTDMVQVSVVTNPTVSITPSPAAFCAGGSIVLTASGASTYSWTPAAGLSGTTGASVTASPAATTTYTVTGIAGSGSACQSTASVTVTVNPLPAAPTVTSPVNLCQFAVANPLTATSSGAGFTLIWYTQAIGGTALPGAPTPSTATATPLDYYVSQKNNTTGCEGLRAHIVVNVNQKPNVSAGNDITICIGGSGTLTATGATTYAWSPAAGLSPTTGASVSANPPSTSTYVVIGTTTGCSDTDTVVVNVIGNPVVTVAPPSASICNGDTVSLTASGANTYSWTPATGLITTTGATVQAHPATTTTYIVTGIAGSNNCQDTQSVTVTVNPLPGLPTVPAAPSYCQFATASPLTATPGIGMTLVWYATLTGGSPLPGAPIPSTATTGPTSYYVAQQNNATGCTGLRATITVTINPKPNVNAGADLTVCTASTVTLTATGAAAYSWSPAISCSNPSCASGTTSPAATTSYVVTGATSFGCADTDTVVVNVITNPAVTVTPAAGTVCVGSCDTLTALGGSSYTWSPAAGLSATTGATVVACPSVTTTYTVIGVAGSNNCSDTAQVVVTVAPLPPAPTVTTPVNYCQNATATPLTATATGTNGLVWYDAATGGLSLGGAPTPLTTAAGNDTFWVSQQNPATGCEGPRAMIVVIVHPTPVVSAGADQTVCGGTTVTLTASGAATYTWSPAITCANPACASGTTTVNTTTDYVVTGTSAFSCTASDTVTVNVIANPTVTVSPNASVVCPGTSVTLQAGGATSYTWTGTVTCNDPTACSNVTVTPSATTTYVVTGSATTGTLTCTDTAHATVTISSTPIITITGNTSICAGGSTTLTANGATNYTWNPGVTCNNASCSNATASPANTTTYTVVGSSGVGCQDSVNVTVTVQPLPVITATTSTPNVCPGDTAHFAVTPTAGLTFSWSPAITCSNAACSAGYALPTTTTDYVVTGSTSLNCTGTDTVTVNVFTPPVVTVTAAPDSICKFGSTQLTASGAISYQWLNPTTGLSSTTTATPTASPLATTTYVVKGTDANGCRDTTNVTVNVVAPPNIVATAADNSICAGTCTQLNASGAASYVWSPAGSLSDTGISNPNACPAATTTYTVIGTSSFGCKDTFSVTVTVNPLPQLNAGPDTSVCLYSGVQLNATPATGLNYFWSPAAGLSNANIHNPLASPQSTTTYQAVVFDTNGCSDTDAVMVTVLPQPVVDAGPDQQICPGTSTQLTASGAVGYQWSSPNNSLSPTTTATTTATPPANTIYTVIGTGPNGCRDTDQVAVTLYPLPPVSAGQDVVICEGGSVQLSASGANTYVWSPATGLSDTSVYNPIASPASTITYTLTGTDANGCMNTDDITVTVVPKLPINVGPGDTICLGESAQLYASGGTNYTWVPSAGLSDPTVAAPVATPDQTTDYTVYIQQGNCFADTQTVTVVVNPVPHIELGADQTIISGNTYNFNAPYSNVDSFRWSPAESLSCADCANPVALPVNTTTYYVNVSNQYGCLDSDHITITVICDGSQLWMPNTFTPNGDGENDLFYAHGKGISKIELFRIYSRWGEVVYEAQNIPANDPGNSWDGTFHGVPLKPDVYVYVITAICGTGSPILIKGDVSIIR